MTKQLLIATKNPNKVREYKEMLFPLGYTIKTLIDFPNIADVKETGATFEENATLKAQALVDATHLSVLADDSGLEVNALDGEPGVHSARYAGDHDDAANNAKLLANLANQDDRSANFTTWLVLLNPDYSKLVVHGDIKGEILEAPRGQNGFGYDPLFYVSAKHRTMAEMTDAQKNAISHRGAALRKMIKLLK